MSFCGFVLRDRRNDGSGARTSCAADTPQACSASELFRTEVDSSERSGRGRWNQGERLQTFCESGGPDAGLMRPLGQTGRANGAAR